MFEKLWLVAKGWPHRCRCADKRVASKHGLVPIRSKPADKETLSVLLSLSTHCTFALAFILHGNKNLKKEIFVFVKLMGEAQGEIKHYYQDTTKRPPHVKPNCSLSVM